MSTFPRQPFLPCFDQSRNSSLAASDEVRFSPHSRETGSSNQIKSQRRVIKNISLYILRFFGWRLQADIPPDKKFIIIGAPHTSNWDFPLALLALAGMGLNFNWVGKHTLFRFPFGFFFKALGGIPVDRNIRQSFIQKMIDLFSTSEELILAIAPEGTRAKTGYWKTGFYSIAVDAGTPIALGYLDYKNKTMGIGATLFPTRDIEKDFHIIQEFYANKTGRFPEKQGPIQLRQKEILRYHSKLNGCLAQNTSTVKQTDTRSDS